MLMINSLLIENHELNDNHINVLQKILHQFHFKDLKALWYRTILDFGETITLKYFTPVHVIE